MTTLSRETRPRPQKINGTTIIPRWPWSKGYAACVREVLGKPRRTQADYEKDAIKYARWLAARDGIETSGYADCVWDYGPKGKRTGKTFIREVGFYHARRLNWRGDPDFDSRRHISTVEIPNHDYAPDVIETTLPEPVTGDLIAA